MRKQGLCAHKVWPHFWNNFTSYQKSLIQFTAFMQLFIGNLMQLVDFSTKEDTYRNVNICILCI